MEKRTRILALVFGVVIAYVLISRAVFPRVEYLFKLEETIASLEDERDKLVLQQERVERAARDYREFAARIGSMDPFEVKNRLQKRLQNLADACKLTDLTVSVSKPGSADRKTGVIDLKGTVKGDGDLQAATQFLEKVANLPELTQITTVSLMPVSSGRRGGNEKRVGLTVNLTAKVLPEQDAVLDQKLETAFEQGELEQPDSYDRAAELAYAEIWRAEPFWEHEIKVVRRPPPDTQVKKDDTPPPPPPPPPPVDKHWKDRNRMRLVWAGTYGSAESRKAACLVTEESRRGQTDETRRIALGEDFDGGTLLYVHQSGVLVLHEDEFLIYPLGKRLDEERKLDEARAEFPALSRAYTALASADRTSALDGLKLGPGLDPSRADGRSPEEVEAMSDTEVVRELERAFLGQPPADQAEEAKPAEKPRVPRSAIGRRGTKRGGTPAKETGNDQEANEIDRRPKSGSKSRRGPMPRSDAGKDG